MSGEGGTGSVVQVKVQQTQEDGGTVKKKSVSPVPGKRTFLNL